MPLYLISNGIVKQNLVMDLCIKALCLIPAAPGIANMWVDVLADEGVMIAAVLNAIRCMFIKDP